MAIWLHRSNRLENLAAALAEVAKVPAGPFVWSEPIIVHSRGMERWLAMQLAERLGIWANPRFPFPRNFIDDAFTAVLGPPTGNLHAFAPQTLTWVIADLLESSGGQAAYAALQPYLAEDPFGLKRLQLATRIAHQFDQYTIYRPDMIAAWQQGQQTDWQAELWRAVIRRLGPGHRTARAEAFFTEWARCTKAPAALGTRACLFGIISLPPLYVRVLASLAERIDIHLFIPSPSSQYWGDLRSWRQQAKPLRRDRQAVVADEDLSNVGHPLLASLGGLGQEFDEILLSTLENVPVHEPEIAGFVDPGTTTLLSALQSDMLHLRNRRASGGDASPLPVDPADRSISLHSCHSPQREVEVLHDQITHRLLHDTSLQPEDIVVMTPDIERYTAFIEAVFGRCEPNEPGYIPYTIADRGICRGNGTIATFFSLLELLQGRMPASEVLDWIAQPTVCRRFELDAAALAQIRTWVRSAGIRWGENADHRSELGLPPFEENSWRFGLERLLLGYALPEPSEPILFHGVRPCDDVEGKAALALGTLAEIIENLMQYRRDIRQPRTLPQWSEWLTALIGQTMQPEPEETWAPQRLRTAVAGLSALAQDAGFFSPVPFVVIQSWLVNAIEEDPPSHRFLAGGITFCRLIPMRSIPFRVIFLLGLNDDTFPRNPRPPAFDRMTQQPRRGDRSARLDDRYLFLDALLSARDQLGITYVGQSIQDNRVRPPSVVVSELLDVLCDGFFLDEPPSNAAATGSDPATCPVNDPEALRQRLVVRHPLQPFSPRYFEVGTDDRLFSYHWGYRAGAQALRRGPIDQPPFLAAPLPPADRSEPVTEIPFDDLVRFWSHPTRFLLQRRLGLRLDESLPAVADRESLTLDPLARHELGSLLLDEAMCGRDLNAVEPLVRAGGLLPPGNLGRGAFQARRTEAKSLVAAIRPWTAGKRLAHQTFALTVAGFRVTGQLDHLWSSGQVAWQYGRLQARRQLSLWLAHLVLNALGREDLPTTSILVGRAGSDAQVFVFGPVVGAADLLAGLVQRYLCGQQVALPLFAESSLAYAQAIATRGPNPEAQAYALGQARKQYAGNSFQAGESADLYIRQVFGSSDPLDPDFCVSGPPGQASWTFAKLALDVFGPLLEHRQETES